MQKKTSRINNTITKTTPKKKKKCLLNSNRRVQHDDQLKKINKINDQ